MPLYSRASIRFVRSDFSARTSLFRRGQTALHSARTRRVGKGSHASRARRTARRRSAHPRGAGWVRLTKAIRAGSMRPGRRPYCSRVARLAVLNSNGSGRPWTAAQSRESRRSSIGHSAQISLGARTKSWPMLASVLWNGGCVASSTHTAHPHCSVAHAAPSTCGGGAVAQSRRCIHSTPAGHLCQQISLDFYGRIRCPRACRARCNDIPPYITPPLPHGIVICQS